MKTKAAVAFGAGKPLEVVEVDLDGPRAGKFWLKLKPPVSVIRTHLPYPAMIQKVPSRQFWVTRVQAWWLMWARA